MTTEKINLLDYDRTGLRDVFAELGEKPYRAEQVMKWIYHRHVTDFAQSIDANAVHGSDAPETAKVEIGYFFSDIELCPR